MMTTMMMPMTGMGMLLCHYVMCIVIMSLLCCYVIIVLINMSLLCYDIMYRQLEPRSPWHCRAICCGAEKQHPFWRHSVVHLNDPVAKTG